MTRKLSLLLVFLALAALAHADLPRTADPEDALAQFRRNQPLIEALVDSGLRLMDEDDPLARADACTQLARQFAAEVEDAFGRRDTARAAEVGRHLSDLLEHGVAENLRAARKLIPQGSTAEVRLRDVTRQALELLEPLRASLRTAGDATQPDELRTALENLFYRQAHLEKLFRHLQPAGD